MRLFSIERDQTCAVFAEDGRALPAAAGSPEPTLTHPATYDSAAGCARGSVLAHFSAGDQLVYDRDHRKHQKNVEKTAGGEGGHQTQQPKDQKNHSNGVEHDRSPGEVAIAGCVRL